MLKSLTLALVLVAVTGPALANCYENLGCDDSSYYQKQDLKYYSCQVLWDIRNSIYKQNGYCFSTKRAINYFGNEGCWIEDQGDVKLNTYERHNVTTISAVEHQMGCS